MLAQAVVERREHHPAGIVAVAGLEEDHVDRAVFVLSGVGAERLAAGDEILDCGLVQFVAGDVPLLEMRCGDVGDGPVAVDGISHAKPRHQRLPDVC